MWGGFPKKSKGKGLVLFVQNTMLRETSHLRESFESESEMDG